MLHRQFDLFALPVIERVAPFAVDTVFMHCGRALRVSRTFGTNARAPVIVEELASFGTSTLKGQFSLWSYDAVSRAMRSQ